VLEPELVEVAADTELVLREAHRTACWADVADNHKIVGAARVAEEVHVQPVETWEELGQSYAGRMVVAARKVASYLEVVEASGLGRLARAVELVRASYVYLLEEAAEVADCVLPAASVRA